MIDRNANRPSGISRNIFPGALYGEAEMPADPCKISRSKGDLAEVRTADSLETRGAIWYNTLAKVIKGRTKG